jgi:ribose transport system permease protein
MSGSEERAGGASWRRLIAEYLGLACALGAMTLVFSLRAEHFFSQATFITIANQIPEALLVAIGMTFVILIGGIDLSVGSVMGLSGAMLGAAYLSGTVPMPLAMGLCLLTGLLCGLINGATTVGFRLPSFIVTLGMLEAARGGSYLVTGSRTQYIGSAVEGVSAASLWGLSLPFLLALCCVIGAQVVLWKTRFGRYVLAIGSNEEAARLSGIRTGRVQVAVFTLCGLLTGLAAIINASRLASADPNAGYGLELQAIAAVVIGGTSLMGGRGSVIGSFFGVLIIAVLGNGLAQIGAQEPTKRLITGCVIVMAVILDVYRSRLTRR